jgi:hypothetical protein
MSKEHTYSSFTPADSKQSKNLLARLLSSEGIDVVHDSKAATAAFDVKNRQLILPAWESMSNELYDMFVGHEVGHALFTPYDAKKEESSNHQGDWCATAQEIGGDNYGHVAQQYLNIIEDARIERMMKDKFPGLRRDFVVAYNSLLEKDFFQLKNNPAMTRLFVDRANLYFKIGVSGQRDLGIQFSEREQVLINRMASTQTWEDVVQLTRDVFEYEREEMEKRSKEFPQSQKSMITSSKEGMESETEKLLESAKNQVKTLENVSNSWIMPKPDLDEMIMTAAEVQELIDNNTKLHCTTRGYADFAAYYQQCMETLAKHYLEQNKRSVAVLVKQFEMKKAASLHKRQLTTKTGRLDLDKIIQYRFNDDLFAKNLILRKGKNHGFVLFVDWSSSMHSVIQDVIRHAFMIAQFCKQCNIPFVVYAFSDRMPKWELDIGRKMIANGQTIQTNKSTDPFWAQNDSPDKSVWFWPTNLLENAKQEQRRAEVSQMNLIEVCSSKMNNAEMIRAYANMLRAIKEDVKTTLFNRHAGQNRTVDGVELPPIPAAAQRIMPGQAWGVEYYTLYRAIDVSGLALGGTPLDETVWAANDVVSRFQKENNVEVMNTIFLSDGQGSQIFRAKYDWSSNWYGETTPNFATSKDKVTSACLLKTGKCIYDVHKIIDPSVHLMGGEGSYSFTFRALIQLHRIITGAKTIGIFVAPASRRGVYYGEHSIAEMLGMEESVKNEMNEEVGRDFMTDKEYDEHEKRLETASKMFEQELDSLSSKKNTNAYLWKKEGYISIRGIGNSRVKGILRHGGGEYAVRSISQQAKLQVVSPYDVLYCIRGDSLAKTDSHRLDKVASGSTVTEIRKAFSAQMKASSMNKTLLIKIADSISGEI